MTDKRDATKAAVEGLTIWIEGGGFFANTAIIATTSVTSPLTTSVIVSHPAEAAHAAPNRPAHSIPIPPLFKMIFLTVVAFTAVAGILQIVLAHVWHDPTPNQQSAFAAMEFAWKMGLGAILGLLGGRAAE